MERVHRKNKPKFGGERNNCKTSDDLTTQLKLFISEVSVSFNCIQLTLKAINIYFIAHQRSIWTAGIVSFQRQFQSHHNINQFYALLLSNFQRLSIYSLFLLLSQNAIKFYELLFSTKLKLSPFSRFSFFLSHFELTRRRIVLKLVNVMIWNSWRRINRLTGIGNGLTFLNVEEQKNSTS